MVIGMIAGMVGGTFAVARLGRHVLHIGLSVIAAGTAVLALMLTGAHSASSWDLLPGLFLIGAGAGASIGQLFQFILASVSMREVGSASGVLEATQQLSTSLGVAILGTIFISDFGSHLATHALQVTSWACLVPIAIASGLVFRLPMHAREEAAQ
jgi:MFS family permease